jgi:hypothetical protein
MKNLPIPQIFQILIFRLHLLEHESFLLNNFAVYRSSLRVLFGFLVFRV